MDENYRNLFEKIAHRYGGVDLEGLETFEVIILNTHPWIWLVECVNSSEREYAKG